MIAKSFIQFLEGNYGAYNDIQKASIYQFIKDFSEDKLKHIANKLSFNFNPDYKAQPLIYHISRWADDFNQFRNYIDHTDNVKMIDEECVSTEEGIRKIQELANLLAAKSKK